MNAEGLEMLKEIKGYVDTVTERLIKADKCSNEEKVKELHVKFTEEFNRKHGTDIGWVTFYIMMDAWMEHYPANTLLSLTLDRMLEEFDGYLLYSLKVSGKL